MRIVIIMLGALLLAGCGLLEARPSAVAVCPAVKTYDRDFLAAAAAEQPQAGPHIQVMIADYKDERNRLRACQDPVR